MNVHVVDASASTIAAEWLIVGAFEPAAGGGALPELDRALGGRLTRLRETGDLTGKHAELVALREAGPLAARRLLIVGLGKVSELTVPRLEKAYMTAVRHVSEKNHPSVALAVPQADGNLVGLDEVVETIVTSATVGCVGQATHKTEPARFAFEDVTLLLDRPGDVRQAEAAARRGQIVGEAINVVRALVNCPAQELYPESFAQRATEIAADFGLACGVLDESRLRQEKMGALLAVGQGSARPPRLVVLEYDGAPDDAPRIALVGKGVTFDSGGLSIKPTDGMLTMKCDMAGAATVLGAMVAIARLKIPINVSGYLGLVENMISGESYKLGDVLRARSGTTIEVNNTDAEGRLVLADVLNYAVEAGADRIVDLATLTGACVVALGEDVTGVFTNDQPWCDQVLAAARRAGEDVWQLPMFDHFAELIKSDVADVKQSGGRWGGAVTAAKFLEKFVGGKPWVHLDIAGPAFASSSKPHREGGGTGCMVRTLIELAARFAP